MSGKAAAFGGRMMNSVADQILKQFADNLAVKIKESSTDSATATSSSPQEIRSTQNELNGLALVWAVIRDWFRALFGRKSP